MAIVALPWCMERGGAQTAELYVRGARCGNRAIGVERQNMSPCSKTGYTVLPRTKKSVKYRLPNGQFTSSSVTPAFCVERSKQLPPVQQNSNPVGVSFVQFKRKRSNSNYHLSESLCFRALSPSFDPLSELHNTINGYFMFHLQVSRLMGHWTDV